MRTISLVMLCDDLKSLWTARIFGTLNTHSRRRLYTRKKRRTALQSRAIIFGTPDIYTCDLFSACENSAYDVKRIIDRMALNSTFPIRPIIVFSTAGINPDIFPIQLWREKSWKKQNVSQLRINVKNKKLQQIGANRAIAIVYL